MNIETAIRSRPRLGGSSLGGLSLAVSNVEPLAQRGLSPAAPRQS
ncbi:hypothetical protein [Roseiflexus sp.]|nr:hypothetical protein [Roseiflexus sp.]